MRNAGGGGGVDDNITLSPRVFFRDLYMLLSITQRTEFPFGLIFFFVFHL